MNETPDPEEDSSLLIPETGAWTLVATISVISGGVIFIILGTSLTYLHVRRKKM